MHYLGETYGFFDFSIVQFHEKLGNIPLHRQVLLKKFPSNFRIHDEIARLEKLQKLAEKVHQEAKVTDSKLDDIEAWIEEEAKRVDHLHPKDAKNNCDQIERELQRIDEEVIKQMFNDVKVLRDNRYSQANELHRRYKI